MSSDVSNARGKKKAARREDLAHPPKKPRQLRRLILSLHVRLLEQCSTWTSRAAFTETVGQLASQSLFPLIAEKCTMD